MNILIIHSSALGDFITFLPFLKLLTYNYPYAKIDIFTKERYFPVLKYYSVKFYNIENYNFFKLFNERFLEKDFLFFKKYNLIISFIGSSNVIFRKNLKQLNKNSFFIFPHNREKFLHNSLYLIEKFPFEKIKFFYPEINVKFGKSEYFLIHPGSGSNKKNMPLNFYKKLAQLLEKEYNLPVKFIGGENEIFFKHKINIEIFKNIRLLLKIFEKARFYIGNDSGVSHLSAATNLLTFTFFGPTTPYIWAPIGGKSVIFYNNKDCSPCFPDCCELKECMDFNVEKIFEQIKKKGREFLCPF